MCCVIFRKSHSFRENTNEFLASGHAGRQKRRAEREVNIAADAKSKIARDEAQALRLHRALATARLRLVAMPRSWSLQVKPRRMPPIGATTS